MYGTPLMDGCPPPKSGLFFDTFFATPGQWLFCVCFRRKNPRCFWDNPSLDAQDPTSTADLFFQTWPKMGPVGFQQGSGSSSLKAPILDSFKPFLVKKKDGEKFVSACHEKHLFY